MDMGILCRVKKSFFDFLSSYKESFIDAMEIFSNNFNPFANDFDPFGGVL